jgi:outer membrane lipoprotein-sorting protein
LSEAHSAEPKPIVDENLKGPYATTVFKEMERKWRDIETFHARIVQVHRDRVDHVVARYEGEMWLHRPHQIRINYRRTLGDPAGAITSATAGAIASATAGAIAGATDYTHIVWAKDPEWIYEYNTRENTLSRDDLKTISSIPFIQAVAGIEAFKEEEFRKKHWVKEPLPVGKYAEEPVYLLRTKPLSVYAGEYHPFDIWLGEQDTVPRLITLYLNQDTDLQETIDIRIKSFEVNPTLPEDLFKVSIPDNVTVVDRGDI